MKHDILLSIIKLVKIIKKNKFDLFFNFFKDQVSCKLET